jgi:hypothetical protein
MSFRVATTITLLAIIVTSCKTYQNKALQEESTSFLETIALSTESPETKYHTLGQEVVKLLEDALANDTDSAMLADMRVFVAKHDYPIKEIQKEFDLWFQHLRHEDRVAFLIRLDHQDYIAKMRTLESRFRQRTGSKNGYWPVWENLVGVVALWR